MESSALRGSVRPEFPPPRQSDVLNSGQRSSTERNPRLVTPPLVTGGSHRSACRSPMSPESFGIETVDHSVRDPFEAADHMVDEMTAALLETAMSTSPQSDPVRGHLMRDSIGMQTQEEWRSTSFCSRPPRPVSVSHSMFFSVHWLNRV